MKHLYGDVYRCETPDEYKQLMESKERRGIFLCKWGKVNCVLDNMQGEAIDASFYYPENAKKYVADLLAKYNTHRSMRIRDLSKGYGYLT